MNFHGYDAGKAIANCGSSQGQQHPKTSTLNDWQTPGPDHVVDLLDSTAFAARPDARQLAGLLAQHPWRILASAHAASTAGLRDADDTPRITLRVCGRTYQLHCKHTPALHVTRITA